MEEQKAFVEGAGDLGGTMRLGTYPAHLAEGSVLARTYGTSTVDERHRHRYEVNNAYRDQLEEAGLRFAGTSPDGTLVEFVELPADVHPYYVSTQAHPEFKSRPHRAHPLFAGLVGAAIDAQRASRLVEVERQVARDGGRSVTLGAPTARTAELVDRLERAAGRAQRAGFRRHGLGRRPRHRGPRRGRHGAP